MNRLQSSIETASRRAAAVFLLVLLAVGSAMPMRAAGRKVIVDQDTRGPATSDLQAVALLLQDPSVEVLGLAVVSGDVWRDEGMAHALRLLEVTGRTDVPALPGAVYPLVHTRAESLLWEKVHGAQVFTGAWLDKPSIGFHYHEPGIVPSIVEGAPTLRPATEAAASFMVRKAREFPGEITIIALGPLTDIALAVRLDPEFPSLVKEFVFMGGSFSPPLDNYFSAEYVNNPRHEFNLWWDAEAARIVLHAPWKKITNTPTDISLKTKYTAAIADRVAAGKHALHASICAATPNSIFPMWDELAVAAWLDEGIITAHKDLFMDVDIDHGAAYGNTLSWTPGSEPGQGEQRVRVNTDLDLARFADLFVHLMQRPPRIAP